MGRTPGKTDERPQAFADAYLVRLDATEAAIDAGYDEENAEEIGRALLQKPSVQKMIKAGLRTLTDMQRVFIDEYLIDLDATNAAIRAGYSPRSAGSLGYQLRHMPHIAAYIDIALAVRSKRTGISADRVLRELARMALADISDLVTIDREGDVRIRNLDNVEKDDTAAIHKIKTKRIPTAFGDGIEVSIEIHDKVGPLKLLGAHLGLKFEGPSAADTAKNLAKELNLTIEYAQPKPPEPEGGGDG